MTESSNKLISRKNNGSWPASRKNNGNDEFDRFGGDSVKHARKSGNLKS